MSARGRMVLALDSCGPETMLCLAECAESGIRMVRKVTLPPRTAGAQLLGGLREVLGGRAASSLAAIVAVRGPGSFTGMRVGLSAAKALAEASGVPIVAVSRLAVLAKEAGAKYAALHAGRASVYLRVEPGGEERLLAAAETRAVVGQEAELAICDDRLATLFPEARRVSAPSAENALLYALDRVTAEDWDDPAALDALYLWRPDQMLRMPVA